MTETSWPIWSIQFPLRTTSKAMAPHSSTLAWRIPWMEEPGALQFMELLSRTWLSDFTYTFHSHVLEKAMATHSSVLTLRVPGTGKPGGLLSMGSHRVRHDWSDLTPGYELFHKKGSNYLSRMARNFPPNPKCLTETHIWRADISNILICQWHIKHHRPTESFVVSGGEAYAMAQTFAESFPFPVPTSTYQVF